jgi:hypothetical protein
MRLRATTHHNISICGGSFGVFEKVGGHGPDSWEFTRRIQRKMLLQIVGLPQFIARSDDGELHTEPAPTGLKRPVCRKYCADDFLLFAR